MTHTDHPLDTDAGASASTPGLNLDARQRAMLEEMGVRVWWPEAAPAMASAAALAPAAPPAPAKAATPARATGPQTGMAVPAIQQQRPSAPFPTATATAPLATTTLQTTSAPGARDAPGAWSLQPPQPLFPSADPQRTPAALGAGWLIVVEGRAGSDPLAGDAGRLLENMLRALQLHHHPRAFVCLLDAPLASDTPAPGGMEALQSAVAAVQPAVLLLLGRTAARVLLGRSEPLGQLRTLPLQVAGVPTVVGYDTPYLLRAQQAKAQAWADLCRARALAGAGAGTSTARPNS